MSCGPEVGPWEGAGHESRDPVCPQEWEVVWVGHFHYTRAPNPQTASRVSFMYKPSQEPPAPLASFPSPNPGGGRGGGGPREMREGRGGVEVREISQGTGHFNYPHETVFL